MKKQIITGLVVLGIAALIFLSYKGNKATLEDNSFSAQSSTVIEIVNNDQELGDIPMSKGKVQLTYILKNIGSEDVILGKAETSCMCTDAYLIKKDGKKSITITMPMGTSKGVFLNETIGPGESRELVATYDPNAHGPSGTGPISRTITIETNSNKTSHLSFNFFGDVVK